MHKYKPVNNYENKNNEFQKLKNHNNIYTISSPSKKSYKG